jgi:hypothetical protein
MESYQTYPLNPPFTQTRMSTFQEQLTALNARIEASQAQQRKLEQELEAAEQEKQRLISAEEAANSGLTFEEVATFRRALTVVGGLLARPDCMFGKFSILDEDPDETDGGYANGDEVLKFSFSITQSFVNDIGPGLRTTVSLKTKNKGIKAIVHEMLIRQGPQEPDADEFPDLWYVDWDYHQSIELRGAVSQKEFFADHNRFH